MMTKLSRFCREQLTVQGVSLAAPVTAQIDCLNARAKHFHNVLTGPQAACLFGDQREAVEGYLRQVLAGVAKLRKIA